VATPARMEMTQSVGVEETAEPTETAAIPEAAVMAINPAAAAVLILQVKMEKPVPVEDSLTRTCLTPEYY